MPSKLDTLLGEIARCQECQAQLPHAPRPVLRAHRAARVIIIGQAPGSKVHASGEAWADDSGDHLIEWLGIDRSVFDDARAFAMLPMGFCYPGRGKSADLPPRPECAPLWHERVRAELGHVRLTLLVGQYAQHAYLGRRGGASLTQTVRDFEDHLPTHFPLPHPSWRSRTWMKRNPWFEADVLPELRRRVVQALGDPPGSRHAGSR